MKTIVLTIGTVPYGTSKYLVEIIQPTLNKNKHRVVNSSSFVNEEVKKKFKCHTTSSIFIHLYL